MADRVPASIRIGGTISAATYAELLVVITFEGLSEEWGGAYPPHGGGAVAPNLAEPSE